MVYQDREKVSKETLRNPYLYVCVCVCLDQGMFMDVALMFGSTNTRHSALKSLKHTRTHTHTHTIGRRAVFTSYINATSLPPSSHTRPHALHSTATIGLGIERDITRSSHPSPTLRPQTRRRHHHHRRRYLASPPSVLCNH